MKIRNSNPFRLTDPFRWTICVGGSAAKVLPNCPTIYQFAQTRKLFFVRSFNKSFPRLIS